MSETVLNLLVGAGIAIVSGLLTKLVEHNLRYKEEMKKREWESQDQIRNRKYELLISNTNKAEKYLQNIEDGYFVMAKSAVSHYVGNALTKKQLAKIESFYDLASKDFSHLLIFEDGTIKKQATQILQRYMDEHLHFFKTIKLPKDQLPQAEKENVRLALVNDEIRSRVAKIRKQIDELKVAS